MKDRLFTFLLLVGSIGAVIVGALVGQRFSELSDDALAWMSGSFFGCALMLIPIAVLLGVAWFALRWKEASAASRSHPQQLQPPVVIVAGGQVAPYQAAQSLPTAVPAEWQHASGARQYTIIGED
jgi:hypothetical protein